MFSAIHTRVTGEELETFKFFVSWIDWITIVLQMYGNVFETSCFIISVLKAAFLKQNFKNYFLQNINFLVDDVTYR